MQFTCDDIAAKLSRPSLNEIHRLVWELGNSTAHSSKSWTGTIPAIHELLLAHKWNFDDYLNECEDSVHNHPDMVDSHVHFFTSDLFMDEVCYFLRHL